MTILFYRDSGREHRWVLRARNGQIIGASTEGYVNASDCRTNAQLVTRYRWRPSIREIHT